jgi:hypothetical protein
MRWLFTTGLWLYRLFLRLVLFASFILAGFATPIVITQTVELQADPLHGRIVFPSQGSASEPDLFMLDLASATTTQLTETRPFFKES